ncbi:phage tail protein I [Escherichia coli]|nr:phage tail protein I [Escherichia coli]
MSEPSLLPPSASDFMRCVERGTTRLSALPVSLNQLWDPDTCPVALLPYLAWALSVDRWDRDWTEETKRQVIRDAWAIHRHKGTIAAIRHVVEPFGYLISITEWWQNSAPRGTFRIDIGIQDTGITEEAYTELARLIDDARPVSRHLTGLNIVLDTQGVFFVPAALYDGDVTTICPWSPGMTETAGDTTSAVAIHIIDDLRVIS